MFKEPDFMATYSSPDKFLKARPARPLNVGTRILTANQYLALLFSVQFSLLGFLNNRQCISKQSQEISFDTECNDTNSTFVLLLSISHS